MKGPDVQRARTVKVGLTLAPQYSAHFSASCRLKMAPVQPPEILHVLNIIPSLNSRGKEWWGSYHSSWSFAEYLLGVCIPGYTSKPLALLHSASHLHSLLLIKTKTKLHFSAGSCDFSVTDGRTWCSTCWELQTLPDTVVTLHYTQTTSGLRTLLLVQPHTNPLMASES